MIHSFVLRTAGLRSVGAQIDDRRLVMAAFLTLAAAMLVPVFAFQVPPMADYVNHLARMHVIAFGNDDPDLNQFYAIHWQIIPNLIMDITVPFLARGIGTYAAGQVFVGLNLLATIGGVVALHRAVTGRLSPWPLVTFLFLYNHALIYGFMNFVFASAVALWALAAWISLRDKSWALRASVSASFVVLLFFCHLFGIGMYGLGLCAVEGWLLFAGPKQNWRKRSVDLLVFGLPFLPVLALMAFSPTLGLATDVSWDWNAKLDGLGWLVQAYGHGMDTAFGFVILFALMLSLILGIIRVHPAGLVLLALGLVVYIAMPTILFGSWAADLRLPVALVFMAAGFADLDHAGPKTRRGFIAIVVVLALLRFGSIGSAWAQIDQSFDDVRASLSYIDPGSKVLVATADHPVGAEAMNLPLSHAACLAMIERSSLVTTAFAVAGKQIMDVRPDFRAMADVEDGDPPNVSGLMSAIDPVTAPSLPVTYWRQWPDRFDFLYVLYTAPGDPNPMPDNLELVYEGRNFQLYEVIPPPRPDLVR